MPANNAGESTRFDYLYEQLLAAGPEELPIIRNCLGPQSKALVERLQKVLHDTRAAPERRLRAACALAGCKTVLNLEAFDSWQATWGVVANQLLTAVQSREGIGEA
jgi:hypothetical protein